MGDRYFWEEDCPNCGHTIPIYYAPSCDIDKVRCFNCGKLYAIVKSLNIEETQDSGQYSWEEKQEPEGG